MYHLDLRFLFPALISFIIFLVQQHPDNPLNLYVNSHILIFNPYFEIFSILIILPVFFLTSIKLPLSLNTDPIRVQAGDFSIPLAILFVASIFLPQFHFWVVFVIGLCLSPWHSLITNMFMKLLCWFLKILNSIPILLINCVMQQREANTLNIETTIQQNEPEIELVEVEVETTIQQNETETEPVEVQVLIEDNDMP